MSVIRWTIKNVGALLLSFILAVTVWASAVITADPNQDGTYQATPIEIVGQAADLLLTNNIPSQATLTMKAPRSIWQQLNNDPRLVRAWIDLSGLAAGEHDVKVNTQVSLNPVRIIQVDPAVVRVILEPFTTKSLPVKLQVKGEPPLGYQKGQPQITPELVSISGPASAIDQVVDVIANLDITGASQTVKTTLPVHAVNKNGAMVSGVDLNPNEVSVIQPINILGGYKNVAVKVLTKGQVASGYRLTNISVTPPTITVYSSDPKFVNELPGYVETMPVDLTGLNDDTEFNAALNLPDELSLVSEPSVLVQIGVAAIEGSLTLSLPVEPLGLPPSLTAIISPPTVDVIVTGPLPVLDTLSSASFRVVVDLNSLIEGTYQIAPTLDLVPEDVQIQAILPETVEVTIIQSPTPTPTRAVTGTPRVTSPATPSPMPTPSP